ncbi:MAG: serine protease [Gammaproteobacteria bacterium]|nr:serine protease [Gammaproteobacteria bacterium]
MAAGPETLATFFLEMTMTEQLLQQLAHARTALAARVSAHTVGVVVRRRTFSGIGWGEDTVLTAAEPLAGAHTVTLVHGERERSAEVLASDLATDVAVLRATVPLATRPQRNAAPLEVGEPLLIAGRQRGRLRLAWTYAAHVGPAWESRRGGRIASALGLAGSAESVLEGAGIFRSDGSLAGMAVTGPGGRILGIPEATLASVTDVVTEKGYLPQPYLGVALQGVWLEHGPKRRASALVTGIAAGSPAATAELRIGDLLLCAEGRPLGGPLELMRHVRGCAIGSSLALQLLRGGEERQVRVILGERPRGQP